MKDLMEIDLYELLKIKKTASESEIKKAYRKKALTCHPDKNPDDPKADEDFKQLTKAVEILTNEITRAHYNRLLCERKARANVILIRNREKAARKAAMEKEEAKRKKEKEEARKKKEKEEAKKRKEKEEAKRKKEKEEEKRKGCSYKKDAKTYIPSWPPSLSKTMKDTSAYRRYMKLKKERTIPTWPPAASKSDSETDSDSNENMHSSNIFNSTPIVRPATFVAPSCSDFKNLWLGSNQIFSPLIKPAKFVAPSNSKNSDGFHSTHQKSSSPLLKPATFVAPSKS